MKPVPVERYVGPYRLLADIGRGGMGRVYLAVGPDGHLVALKQILEQFSEEPDFRARFTREVAASRRVHGPYTAAVIDADAEADVPWLVSELIVGPSLRQVIREVGVLPEQVVLRLTASLVTALTAIHSENIVHRDLNPGNVLLAGDGAKVLDFGIARALDGQDSSVTRTGLIGAPGFMSPEQADGGDITASSDMFSLGCVLYMVSTTGASPFEGAGTLQTLTNLARCEPDLDPVPGALRALIEGCLRRNPDDRLKPGEALDLLGELEPGDRPWSTDIYAMIDRQRDEIARIVAGAGDAQGAAVGDVWVADRTVNWPGGRTVDFGRDGGVPSAGDETPPDEAGAEVPPPKLPKPPKPPMVRFVGPPGAGGAAGDGPASAGGGSAADASGSDGAVSGDAKAGTDGAASDGARKSGPKVTPAARTASDHRANVPEKAGSGGAQPKLTPLPQPEKPPGGAPNVKTVAALVLMLLLVICVAGVINADEDADGDSAADDLTGEDEGGFDGFDDEEEPETDPSVFPDAVAGDCVYNYGDEYDVELDFSNCDSGSFEVMWVLDGVDSSDCSDTDWSVENSRHDMRLCLDYIHRSSAYAASVGDCVFRYGEHDPWVEESCETGSFTVLERLEDESDLDACTDSYRLDWMVSLTVPDHDSLNAVLCLTMNYPDDAGHAVMDNCLAMYDLDDGGRRFEFASCSESNVYVTGRTGTPDDAAFCGNDGWTWWRSSYFPELSYTMCWDWL